MRRWLNGCPAHSQQLYKCAEPGEMITEIPPWECIAGGSRRSLLRGVFVCCLSVITSIHHTRPGAPTRNKTSARPQYFILFWYARTRITKTHDVYSGTLRNSQFCQTSCFRACMAHLWVESVQQDEYTFSKNKHSQSCRRLCQCFRRHLNCVKQKVQQYKSNFSNKHVGLWITQACIFANRWVCPLVADMVYGPASVYEKVWFNLYAASKSPDVSKEKTLRLIKSNSSLYTYLDCPILKIWKAKLGWKDFLNESFIITCGHIFWNWKLFSIKSCIMLYQTSSAFAKPYFFNMQTKQDKKDFLGMYNLTVKQFFSAFSTVLQKRLPFTLIGSLFTSHGLKTHNS